MIVMLMALDHIAKKYRKPGDPASDICDMNFFWRNLWDINYLCII